MNLIILPERHATYFRAKGLSIKAAGNGYAGRELCKDESGYYIDNRFKINPHTCQIEVDKLVEFLKDLINYFPFDNIKLKDNYAISSDELFNKIKKNGDNTN